MIPVQQAVHFVIVLVILGLIFWLLYWVLNVTNPPEPFKKVGTVVLAVIAVLVLIGFLLSLLGIPLFA